MIIEITDNRNPKQQHPFFTAAGHNRGQFRHYQLTTEGNSDDGTFLLMKRLLNTEFPLASAVWMKGQEAFICRSDIFDELDGSPGMPNRYYVVNSDAFCVSVCGASECSAARAVVTLACFPGNDARHFYIEPDEGNQFSVPSFTPNQLQSMLQAHYHFDGKLRNRRTTQFKQFCFTAEQRRAIRSCHFPIDLRIIKCQIDSIGSGAVFSIGSGAVFSRTTSFGNLAITLFASMPNDHLRNRWNLVQLFLWLPRMNPLFDVLSLSRMASANALRVIRSPYSIRRLCLDTCFLGASDSRDLGQVLGSGGTVSRLIVQQDDFDSENFDPLPVLDALTRPTCNLVEFGLFLREEKWTDAVKDKFLEALQQNTTLNTLVFACAVRYGFDMESDSGFVTSIHQHPSIQTIVFRYPTDYDNAEPFDVERAEASLPSLMYLLESDRNFRIVWEEEELGYSSSWWRQSLHSLVRYQQFWRGVVDVMSLFNNDQKQSCFQLVLSANCNDGSESSNPYKSAVVGLLLSEHRNILYEALKKLQGKSTEQYGYPQKKRPRLGFC